MRTLVQLFEDCVAKYSENVFLLEKKNNRFMGATFKEVHEKVLQFAAGLISLGIQKGDRIALISEGRNDWVYCELGILYAGAVNVPLSVKLTESSELKFRIMHSGARFVIASKSQAKKLIGLKDKIDTLEKVILLDQPEKCEVHEIAISSIII